MNNVENRYISCVEYYILLSLKDKKDISLKNTFEGQSNADFPSFFYYFCILNRIIMIDLK